MSLASKFEVELLVLKDKVMLVSLVVLPSDTPGVVVEILIAGTRVSITRSLFLPREFKSPGLFNDKLLLFKAASFIVPPLKTNGLE